MLGDLPDFRETLVHDTPERFDCLGPVIEEIFEQSRIVKRVAGYEYRSPSSP